MRPVYKYLSRYGLITLLLITALAFTQLSKLKFEVITSDYYPRDTKLLADNDLYNELFKKGEDDIVMAIISSQKTIYDQKFLNQLEAFENNLKDLEIVDTAYSLLDLQLPHFVIGRPVFISAIHKSDPDRYAGDSLRIVKNAIFTNSFISRDHKSVCVRIETSGSQDKSNYPRLFQSIRDIGDSMDFEGFYLIGPKVLESIVSEMMLNDLKRLGLILLLVMLLLLFAIFRSIKLVLILLAILFSSLIIGYGLLGIFCTRLEILSNILPVLILVTCVSNSLHLLHFYGESLSVTRDVTESALTAMRQKGLDILLANTTTAFGFVLLYFSQLTALRNFGLMAALVVLVTFLINILWFGFLLPRSGFADQLKVHGNLQLACSRLTAGYNLLKNNHQVFIITVLFILISTAGIFLINTDNTILKNIPERHGLKPGMAYYQEKFGGFRSMDMMIIAKDSNWVFLNYLPVTDTITTLFNGQQELSNILSISAINQHLESQMNSVKDGLLKYTAIKSGLFHNASNITRIRANLMDIGRLKTQMIRDKLRPTLDHLESRFNLNIVDVGEDYLFDKAHEYRINNMFTGLVLSISIISGVILFVYGNPKYLLMVVVANILPLILAAGFMGWTGIELRGATSILFTIGFAIAIDDTIHFISQFRRLKGESNLDLRLSKTLEKTGTPIILSSVVLGLGFLVLIFSQLWDLQMFGLLVASFVVFAVITDVFILPVLIHKWSKYSHNAS